MEIKINQIWKNKNNEEIKIIGINLDTIIFIYTNQHAVGKETKEIFLKNYKITNEK